MLLFSNNRKCGILKTNLGDDMKKLEQEFDKMIFKEMVFSILFAILGVIIIVKSEMTNKVVGILIGLFFLCFGLYYIYTAFEKNKLKIFHYNYIFGILSIVLGILIIFNPFSIINLLNLMLGIWFIVESCNKFVYFLYLRKAKTPFKGILLTSSIFLMIFGIMLLFNPFTTMVITKVVGMFILLYNLINLNDLVLFKRKEKKIVELLK